MDVSLPTGLLVLGAIGALITTLGLLLDLRLIVTGKWHRLNGLFVRQKPATSRDARLYGASSFLPTFGVLVGLVITIARPPRLVAILGVVIAGGCMAAGLVLWLSVRLGRTNPDSSGDASKPGA
jgi:hypothetical protein